MYRILNSRNLHLLTRLIDEVVECATFSDCLRNGLFDSDLPDLVRWRTPGQRAPSSSMTSGGNSRGVPSLPCDHTADLGFCNPEKCTFKDEGHGSSVLYRVQYINRTRAVQTYFQAFSSNVFHTHVVKQ